MNCSRDGRSLAKYMFGDRKDLPRDEGSIRWFLNLPTKHGDRSEVSGKRATGFNLLKALALRDGTRGFKTIAKEIQASPQAVRGLFIETFGKEYALAGDKARSASLRNWFRESKANERTKPRKPKQLILRLPRSRTPQTRIQVAFQCANRRLRNKLRNRLRKHVRGTREFGLVGCTQSEFRNWIENQFTKSMTWANYGSVWHIDHRVPLYRFDLTRIEHRQAASHYTNLRPLLVEHNIKRRREFEETQLAVGNPFRQRIQMVKIA